MNRNLLLIAVIFGIVAVGIVVAGSRLDSASAGAEDLNPLVTQQDSIFEYTTAGEAGTAGYIDTFAGGGAGDGGQALEAPLYGPTGMAFDSDGELFLGVGDCRIRKISAGVITTVAGTGYCVDGPDGGLATETPIQSPFDVATSGNDVYFSDSSCRVRKISDGIITTVAGTGVCEPGPDSGPATSVNLVPTAIEFDGAGNLYIGDSCRVLKLSGGVLSTFAGTGTCGDNGDGGPATTAELHVPTGLAFDVSGDLYITDRFNCRVRRVSGGIISAFAGSGTCGYGGDGGPATAASLMWPGSLEIDSTGDLYIADTVNCRVRKVSGGSITTIAGTGCPSGTSGDGGPATSAGLNMVSGLASMRMETSTWRKRTTVGYGRSAAGSFLL